MIKLVSNILQFCFAKGENFQPSARWRALYHQFSRLTLDIMRNRKTKTAKLITLIDVIESGLETQHLEV